MVSISRSSGRTIYTYLSQVSFASVFASIVSALGSAASAVASFLGDVASFLGGFVGATVKVITTVADKLIDVSASRLGCTYRPF